MEIQLEDSSDGKTGFGERPVLQYKICSYTYHVKDMVDLLLLHRQTGMGLRYETVDMIVAYILNTVIKKDLRHQELKCCFR